ncbi:hypothetical protein FOMPIDRAFT_94722 [Fomitopsis schrenkii]|uniref:Uncharacterized protein n=1 Tax=Fomitopsis schrenkii TaxID=2126942 RepID=S8E3J9_FOMSC|nr:hypothetical protein FOMPIDRAFT_94722 [Fomitopsis schrenkii]
MHILVDALPPLQNMRAAGSVPCSSGAWLHHVTVVQVDPLKDNFRVLYEFCVGINGNWDMTHMPEGCMSLHPSLAQREARLEEAENGLWSSGLVYIVDDSYNP